MANDYELNGSKLFPKFNQILICLWLLSFPNIWTLPYFNFRRIYYLSLYKHYDFACILVMRQWWHTSFSLQKTALLTTNMSAYFYGVCTSVQQILTSPETRSSCIPCNFNPSFYWIFL